MENPKVDEFVNKFLDQTLKQQKLFGKLEKEPPPEAHPAIQEAKEEKVPAVAKEAIRKAQENALKRLQGDLEKMSAEDQEKFKDYVNLSFLEKLAKL